MKKSIIALVTATIILVSTLTPLLYVQTTAAADPADWYKTVNGVLNTDAYSLYPFTSTNLTIGFSKFGELIDGNTKIGLMYGGVHGQVSNVDPFANFGYVPEFEWSQGWLINITYSYTGEFRNVWAFALYADSYSNPGSIGGDWKMAPSPDSTTVIGGRKYGGVRYGNGTLIPIGYATTAPLTVLYDGPRSFIALCNNTIGEDASTPLVSVLITIVFDKVKKYVTLYKDVKLLDARKFTGDLQIEFSNRGEWDLGRTTAPASFAHFFENTFTNSYETGYHPFYSMPDNNAPDAEVTVAQVISSSTPGYVGYAAYWPTPISIWMEATYLTQRQTMLTSLETVIAKFTADSEDTVFSLPNGENHPVEYPRGQGVWKSDPMVFVNGQIKPEDAIDPNGWQWNSQTYEVTFNTAPGTGAKVWIEYKQNVHKTDMSDSPRTPYIIAEWDFVLSWANVSKSTNYFRAVTCYGITDWHDASDGDRAEEGPAKLDSEVMYQLDEVFNPFDLNSAVEKSSSRWVEFQWGDEFPWTSANKPVMDVSDDDWNQYATFSERVIDLNTSKILGRWEYSFSVDPVTGYATISGDIFESDHYYKILYSTDTYYENWGPFNLYEEWMGTTGLGTFSAYDSTSFEDWLGANHYIDVNADFNITVLEGLEIGDNFTLTGALEYEAWDFNVFKEGTFSTDLNPENSDYFSDWHHFGENSYFSIDFNMFDLNWEIESPSLLDLHMDNLVFDVEYSIFVVYNGTVGQSDTWNVTATFNVVPDEDYEGTLPIYTEYIPGRYEWITAGRDAHTVDSLGAANVAAAFKNKFVEIGNAGMDMKGLTVPYEIPYLLSKEGSGNAFTSYWIANDTTIPGQRLALADDWCTRYPVASSNIISVGGPLANQMTAYFNQFTNAFYAEPWFTPYTNWKGALVSYPCWNKDVYKNGATTGYATIGTYLDLNGTVGFVIYGLDARDTYYATKFFHEEIIYELQNFPAGATSIVIKIDYTDAKHPTFTIPEVLGTISETLVEGFKGGIHPDP